MAYYILAILISFISTKPGAAVKIISASRMDTTSFIKINFSHSGQSLQNNFEFILDIPQNNEEHKRYTGSVRPRGARTENMNALTETFLIFDLAGKIKLPCELLIFNERQKFFLSLKNSKYYATAARETSATPGKKNDG